MGWDAELASTTEVPFHRMWSYTYNTTPMIRAALELIGDDGKVPWSEQLHGMSGPRGQQFLGGIIKGMEMSPPRMRAMNPPNGWGDYDSLMEVLRSMHAAVPEFPTIWRMT